MDEAMEELKAAGLAQIEEILEEEKGTTPADPSVTMRIEAPGGALRFEVTPIGMVSLAVSGDKMETFLAMMEWLDKALPVMTGVGPYVGAARVIYLGGDEEE